MRLRPFVHLLIVVAGTSIAAVDFSSVETSAPQPAVAGRLLQRARAAIGGDSVLDKIHGLSFETTLIRPDKSTFGTSHFLIPPDKYANETATATFTFSRGEYWGSGAAIISGSKTGQIEMRRAFWRWMVQFLAPKPETISAEMRIAGREGVPMPDGQGTANVLSYSGPDGFSIDLFLDPASGRPLGYTWPWWRSPPTSSAGFLCRFTTFSAVDGFKFPTESDVTTPGNDGTLYHSVSKTANLKINPAGLAARFQRIASR